MVMKNILDGWFKNFVQESNTYFYTFAGPYLILGSWRQFQEFLVIFQSFCFQPIHAQMPSGLS